MKDGKILTKCLHYALLSKLIGEFLYFSNIYSYHNCTIFYCEDLSFEWTLRLVKILATTNKAAINVLVNSISQFSLLTHRADSPKWNSLMKGHLLLTSSARLFSQKTIASYTLQGCMPQCAHCLYFSNMVSS